MTSTNKNYGLVQSHDELEAFLQRLIDANLPFGLDIETGYSGPDRAEVSVHPDDPDSFIVGLSFSGGPTWARYVAVGHGEFKDNPQNLPNEMLVALWFWKLVATGNAVIHNAKFELRFMSRWFMEHLADHPEVGPAVRAANGYFPFLADTMLESFLAAESQRHGLKSLVEDKLGHTQAEITSLFPAIAKNKMTGLRFNLLELTPEVIDYACEDALWCLALHEYFYPRVKDMLLYPVEHRIVPLLCEMEDYGVRYDWEAMRQTAAAAQIHLDKLNAEIQSDLTEMVGEPVSVNIGSPKQLQDVLYGKLGFKTTRTTKKGGAPSTDEQALTGLAKKYPVVQKILDWKSLRKLIGTYLDKYERAYDYADDGMTHPQHKQAVVPAGRFAVADPPYQQSPKKYHYELNDGSVFECDFRTFVICPPDHYLLGFDFSQVELRVLAGVAKEPSFLHAFEHDEDVHTATAALMLGKPKADVTKEDRSRGKTLNFALLYGMGIKALAERLAVSTTEAESLNERYFYSLSAIRNWIEKTKAVAQHDGYVLTPFGRRVTLWAYQNASSEQWQLAEADRLAVNAPIQGGAADYMKLAMLFSDRALAEAGLKDRVHLAMNIHDALEYYVHKSVDPKTVVDLLADKVSFPVPGFPKIVAEWHMGDTWGTVEEIELVDGKMIAKEYIKEEDFDLADIPDSPASIQTAMPLQAQPQWDQVQYNGQRVGVHDHKPQDPCPVDCPANPDYSYQPLPVPILRAPTPQERKLRIVLQGAPDAAALTLFMKLLTDKPGDCIPVLVMPNGELPINTMRTGLTVADAAAVSLIFGNAELAWDADSVDLDRVVGNIEF